MKNKSYLLINAFGSGLFLLLTPSLQAKDSPSGGYSFEQIWNIARESDLSIQSAKNESEAASFESDRQSRHWQPQLILEATGTQTNSPSLSFFSKLGQRSIVQSDFDPDQLNEPGSSFFTNAKLSLDWKAYEGGASRARAKMAAEMAEAKHFSKLAQMNRTRAELAAAYAKLLALKEQSAQQNNLKNRVEKILNSYKLGSKENLIGRSGLLGLKNLKNRIDTADLQNQSQEFFWKSRIQISIPDLPIEWSIQSHSVNQFIDEHLNPHLTTEPSFQDQAAMNYAKAMLEKSSLNRANFLPSLGLFAEGDLTNGKRDTSTAYAAGAYLRWNIYNAQNWDSVEQARREALMAQANTKLQELGTKNQIKNSLTQIENLRRSLDLMSESLKLLEEQTKNTYSLFQSGTINVLQLVEALSRRQDLIENRARLQFEFINAHSTLALNSNSGVSPNEQ